EYSRTRSRSSPAGRGRGGRRSAGLCGQGAGRELPGRRGHENRGRARRRRRVAYPRPGRWLGHIPRGRPPGCHAARDQQDKGRLRPRSRDHFGLPGRSPRLDGERLGLLPDHLDRRGRRNEGRGRRRRRGPRLPRLASQRDDRPHRQALLQRPRPPGLPQGRPRRARGDSGGLDPPRHRPSVSRLPSRREGPRLPLAAACQGFTRTPRAGPRRRQGPCYAASRVRVRRLRGLRVRCPAERDRGEPGEPDGRGERSMGARREPYPRHRRRLPGDAPLGALPAGSPAHRGGPPPG
ncbi:MAG: DNA mismatch repair protein MutL, partial [uncultured Rubrobacteraceae bacterium]